MNKPLKAYKEQGNRIEITPLKTKVLGGETPALKTAENVEVTLIHKESVARAFCMINTHNVNK